MAIRGKHYSVNVRSRRENGKLSGIGLILFRQSRWGERNGETTLHTYDWSDCMDRVEGSGHVAALSEDDLVNLITGASAMLANIRRLRSE